MQKAASYFVCGNLTYRSEVTYQHERIGAGPCAVVRASGGLSQLHLVEGARVAMTV
jgi:hypothetical protein